MIGLSTAMLGFKLIFLVRDADFSTTWPLVREQTQEKRRLMAFEYYWCWMRGLGEKEKDHFFFWYKIIPEQGTYLYETSSIMNQLYQSFLPNYNNIPVSCEPQKSMPNLFTNGQIERKVNGCRPCSNYKLHYLF